MPERPPAKPCPNCAKPIQPDATKCWCCGTVFNTVPCAECSSSVQIGSTSCWFCGETFAATAPPADPVTECLPPGPGVSEGIQSAPRPVFAARQPSRLDGTSVQNCPQCDAEIPRSATKCKHCGCELEPGGDDNRWLRRVGYAPHRGGSVLTTAILSLVCCGLIFGPIAWSQASSDLREMREGRMDPSGEGLTRAAQIIGAIGTILTLASVGLRLLAALARS